MTNPVSAKSPSESKGSAISEFLIFTLPFVIVILTLTLTVYQKSMAINEAKNLSRQTLRAYITSPSNELAEARAYQVLDLYLGNLSISDANSRRFKMYFECSNNPCLTAGGSVTSRIEISNQSAWVSKVIGSSTEYVDLWR